MEEIFHNYQAKAPKKRREENQKFKKINLPKKKEYDRVVEMVYKEEAAVVKKKSFFLPTRSTENTMPKKWTKYFF